ncbi:MAG: GGDEF domain-containing protein [Lachnospiraceae bacterium]|nr:GGDEF domain-containing protein [Lachnospiraceae bacterium]
MDYQLFVNNLKKLACVISVKINPDGTHSEPCIEAANELYLKSVNVNPKDFVAGRPYYEYIFRDYNFEAMTLRCIFENRLIHSYVNAERYNAWMDIFMMPLVSDDENIGYSLFSYDMTPNVEADKLSDLTAQTAAQVIKTSVKLHETSDFKAAMESVIDDIRITCKANRCCVLLTDLKNKTATVLAHSIVEGEDARRMEDYLDDNFFKIIESWEDLIAGSNCYIIHDEAELEELKKKNEAWYNSLKMAHVTNLVLYPLRANDETIGYIWATNFDASNTINIKQILEITTFLLAAEINNYLLYERMKAQSVTDSLTNVLNRNAMNNRITDIVNGDYVIKNPYGVAFVDLNGLKATNDREGHRVGDQLLKDAAELLKENFEGTDIYRVGGDEFLIIVENKKEEEFNSMIDNVRKCSEESDRIKFAIGSCFVDASFEVREALHIADENMYKEKEKFYINHPEFNRRGADLEKKYMEGSEYRRRITD